MLAYDKLDTLVSIPVVKAGNKVKDREIEMQIVLLATSTGSLPAMQEGPNKNWRARLMARRKFIIIKRQTDKEMRELRSSSLKGKR